MGVGSGERNRRKATSKYEIVGRWIILMMFPQEGFFFALVDENSEIRRGIPRHRLHNFIISTA